MEGVGSVEIHFVQDKFSQSHARVLCRSGVLLTQQQVIEIFEFGGEGLGPRVNAILAKQYGVTAKTIRDIRSGRRWGDLTTALARTRELKGGDFGGRLKVLDPQGVVFRDEKIIHDFCQAQPASANRGGLAVACFVGGPKREKEADRNDRLARRHPVAARHRD